MYKDALIYVAGHTGLLGTALLKRLKSKGYRNIITRPHEELDLTHAPSVDEFFRRERPEFIFLAAGLTGGIVANKTYPATFLHTNIAIQDNLFEAAQRYNVRHLVFYGSSCAYPKNWTQAMSEEYLMMGEIEETSEAYAIAKLAGIKACKAYNRQYDTKRFIALIPNSMYGPSDNFDPETSHVLSALIRKLVVAKLEGRNKLTLWGSGRPRREFIFSEDVADASIFAVENAGVLENTCYNLGTGRDYSIREIAGLISKIVGFTGSIEWDTGKPDGAMRKLLDSSRFRSLGWAPAVSLEDGLSTTCRWYTEKAGMVRNNAK